MIGFLRRLLGRGEASKVPPLPPEQPRASATPLEVEAPRIKDNGFVRIAAQDFFGQAVHSPNGRFLLAWRDQSTFVEEDGTRSVKPGRLLMYEGPVLRAEGVLDRPHDGKVADNGRFILNNWGNSGELSGAFHAFEPDGTAILSRTFSANLNNNGLAPDGRIAVCQTCNAPNSPDSSILAVFDLEMARDLCAWDPRSGSASSYSFPAGGELIALSYTRDGTYLYALDGTFLEGATIGLYRCPAQSARRRNPSTSASGSASITDSSGAKLRALVTVIPGTIPSVRACPSTDATTRLPWSGIAVTIGAGAASGRELAFFLRSRSVDQCGRKSDTTRRIAALHYPAMRIPPRTRSSSTRQRGRPNLGMRSSLG